MKRVFLAALCAFAVLPTQPAHAAATVGMGGTPSTYAFSPATLVLDVRDGSEARRVRWENQPSGDGHSTYRTGVIGWASNIVATGDSWCCKLFNYSGAYPYFCNQHPDMRGTIKLRPFVGRNGSSTIELGQTATVTVAARAAPDGLVFDIQKRTGSGEWTRWKRGVTNASHSYKPSSKGTRLFRSRVRRLSDGHTSGFSPASTLTIT
jgi:plastocyanin